LEFLECAAVCAPTFNIIEGGTFAPSPRHHLLVGKICAGALSAHRGRVERGAAGRLEEFKYYLTATSGLDGAINMANGDRLLLAICGSDDSRWQLAEQTAVDCLEARRALWDGICEVIQGPRIGNMTLMGLILVSYDSGSDDFVGLADPSGL